MVGTFQEGDLLTVVPVRWDEVSPGDVIAFRRSRGEKSDILLCHRVVARTDDGLLTRGDAREARDPEPVHPQDLLGRVSLVRRHGQDLYVMGGLRGCLWVALLSLRRRLLPILRGPYGRLRTSGLLKAAWRPRISKVELMLGDETVVKYLHGGRTVAQLWPRRDRFWCRKPYDLVIENPLTGRESEFPEG